MTFLVDAHLPQRIARRLQAAGCWIRCASYPGSSWWQSHHGCRNQRNLLARTASCGYQRCRFCQLIPLNASAIQAAPHLNWQYRNTDLETLLLTYLSSIVTAFDSHDYIELSRSALIIHAW